MENNPENIEVKIEKKENKTIPATILIAALIIAGSILLRGNTVERNPQNNNTDTTIEDKKPIPIPPITAEDYIFGNPNAKIIIVEYSDTECPFCKIFHNTLHQVIAQNGNKVAWVYRHFPIEGLHPKAFHEAEAIECAGDIGGNDMFWKYLDEVMKRTQSNNKLDVAELPKIAKDLGLDSTIFATCLDSGKFADKINAQISEVINSGARGTPHSFIVVDGKVISSLRGAQPLSAILSQIEAIK